ncbi:unnamed protein product [Linum trigynum]|uniref:Uncharacterized protein n=1 Tax=Linum trigynum TaxID=586398 RepID=A0AAV2E214_9ROSI
MQDGVGLMRCDEERLWPPFVSLSSFTRELGGRVPVSRGEDNAGLARRRLSPRGRLEKKSGSLGDGPGEEVWQPW